jgi:hypothetical protein
MKNRNLFYILRSAVGLLLLLALAAVFFISGWSKLRTIDPFAWSFMDVLPVGITTASVIAHIFIGLEWAIGAWLAAHIYLRRVTYKATILLLVLMSAYLLGLYLHQGNNGNCGCFGEWLYMKPVAAIWKNVVLIALVVLLWIIYPSRPYRNMIFLAFALTAAAFTLPFVLKPLYVHGSGEVVREPIILDSLYTEGNPPPSINLKQGKHIICIFSLTCPHCVKAAYLVQILHRQYPTFPIFMVLGHGGFNDQQFFMEDTKADSVPHTLVMDSRIFNKLSGPYVPSIYFVNNSVIERKVYYTELEPATIKEWLKK